jgi:hypothetical protein
MDQTGWGCYDGRLSGSGRSSETALLPPWHQAGDGCGMKADGEAAGWSKERLVTFTEGSNRQQWLERRRGRKGNAPTGGGAKPALSHRPGEEPRSGAGRDILPEPLLHRGREGLTTRPIAYYL